MVDGKKKKERRENHRIQPEDCSVIVNSKFGEVIDISVGGIAFTYIDHEDGFTGGEGLGLLFGNDDLYIDELPLRIITDCAISEGVSVIRRCGAEFGKLTAKQLSMLEYLIKSNIDDQGIDDESAN